MDLPKVVRRKAAVASPEFDCALYGRDVAEHLGRGSVTALPALPCVCHASEPLVRDLDALDPRRRHALRAQDVPSERVERSDLGRRITQAAERLCRLGDRGARQVSQRKPALGDERRDEDVVLPTATHATRSVGAGVAGPPARLVVPKWFD